MGPRHFRRAAVAAVALALLVPFAAGAGGHSKGSHARDAAKRTLFATDTAGNLLHFRATAANGTRSASATAVTAARRK